MIRVKNPLRHDWRVDEIIQLYELPFNDLLYKAHTAHRAHHDPNTVQLSTLLSIKTGACPEDCAYCPQSAYYGTALTRERLLPVEDVIQRVQIAKDNGATRFCMGAAWRNPTDKNLESVIRMIQAVKHQGLEACATLGMLTDMQARRLKDVGLDYYNHNLDTSPEFYGNIITTRIYQDRLDTLNLIRDVGIKVCCGGILGMGESRHDRVRLLQQLSNLPKHPESVPINMLVQVEGTPLYGSSKLDSIEFVRTIATARLLMPNSFVRLSAGREAMSDETQALCFFAGANSIFFGEKLLTASNPPPQSDTSLFRRLGIEPQGDCRA
jgi:biotin synthase